MGKTFHSKQAYKKLVKDLGISAAKAEASRHPKGTHAKGLRKLAKDKIHIAEDRNRFGDAYEKSSRMRRLRRYIQHSARNKAKAAVREAISRSAGADGRKEEMIRYGELPINSYLCRIRMD